MSYIAYKILMYLLTLNICYMENECGLLEVMD